MVTFSSFRYAFKGLKYVLRSERNARIHVIFAVLALIMSILLRIGLEEWLFVVTSITLVFFAEIINTAIEKTLDLVTQENNQLVKLIKDMTAAGVLVTAIGAVIVASVIFIPRMYELVNGLIK
ncbi:diacylglycerol kinase family protein [Candidatus Saccharibacteria bacterium]|nr:diacylglycerol kinase family protein [Candidatus Saccharibacteria bacterium]